MTKFDSPWKEAVEIFFEYFMAFLFPRVHAEIDWSRGFEFLDKELQQICADTELGERVVDKLVKVWRLDGSVEWVLIHIEIHSQLDPDFAKRMFVYHYRILDRYNKLVASFAVLGDSHADWRPNRFEQQLWGCSIDFQFPIVKLLARIIHERSAATP